jgi:hypothetical protein
VVWSAEHLVAFPTGIGLPRHRWLLHVSLLMSGQVALLCKVFAASLAGEHGRRLSSVKDRMPMMILSPYILYGRGRNTRHPSSYNLIG